MLCHLQVNTHAILVDPTDPRDLDIAALLYEQEASNDGIAHSAKSDYVTMILPRKGLPTDTQIEQPTMSQDKEKRFILHSAAVSIPHPGKVEAGGEDAYFLGTDDDADINSPVNVTCVGVSDGVGSWFEQNIDPSLVWDSSFFLATSQSQFHCSTLEH